MRTPAAPIRALIGLGLGLAAGATIVATGSPFGRMVSEKIEPLGTMWVNGLRMTIVPLVMSLLVATLGSSEGARMFGVLGRKAVGIFLALLVVIAIIGLLAAPPIYGLMHVDPAAAAALRASAGVAPTTTPPTFASWIVGLVPSNVIATASDGAMLPLIVFAALFGLALAKLDAEHRAPAVAFFRTIADAMLAIVRWVLLLAPIGAFALAMSLAVHLGNATASVILFYLVSHSGLLLIVLGLLYVVIPVVTRTSVARFARAMLPAQIVVISTRSSLAALPAMLDGAQRELGVPAPIASFALPLGVSLLRANTGLSWVVCALFLGKLYGVSLGAGQLIGLAAVSIAFSFSVPGIPSGGLLIAAPYYAALGLPVQGIGILIALDAIPDIFKTLINVTSQVSTALILSKSSAATAERPAIASPAAQIPPPPLEREATAP